MCALDTRGYVYAGFLHVRLTGSQVNWIYVARTVSGRAYFTAELLMESANKLLIEERTPRLR